jgi:hypothetical protein
MSASATNDQMPSDSSFDFAMWASVGKLKAAIVIRLVWADA